MANLDKVYTARRIQAAPELKGYWDGPVWRSVETIEINNWHPQSSDHKLTDEQCRLVKVYHSMPDVVDPEIEDQREWTLEFFVPYALLEQYVGPLGDVAGQTWHGNFYKCSHADDAHPHWAAWSPAEILNFHQPRCFGHLHFL